MRLAGNIYGPDHQFHAMELGVEDGRFTAASHGPVVGEAGAYIIPGFIDIHTHGGDGVDINHIDEQSLAILQAFFASQGTTSFLTSVLTDTQEQTLSLVRLLGKHVGRGSDGAQLVGIHLEGPFISTEYKGAMPQELLQLPSLPLFESYQQASGNTVRYITIAPELPGAMEFIQAVHGQVAVSIGHSAATYETACAAIAAGATAGTHTFNAMKLFHMHEPAISGAILEQRIFAEAICDGRHLHPATVRLMLACSGDDKVVAVTDSIMAAGLPDGQYQLGVNEVFVVDGDAKLASGVRAGSTLTTIQALRNLVSYTGSLERSIPLLTENPARCIGLFETKGSIEIGKDADFIILNKDLEIMQVYVRGTAVYTRSNQCH